MPPKVFRESSSRPMREQWPVEFDLMGVERNYEVRKQLAEENMGKEVSNHFASPQNIDIGRPVRVPYDPRQHEYPKMLYHQTQRDKNWLAEHKRLTLYNQLHPEKPEILPSVPFASIIVGSKSEEEQRLKEGWGLRPPALEIDKPAEPVEVAVGIGKTAKRA